MVEAELLDPFANVQLASDSAVHNDASFRFWLVSEGRVRSALMVVKTRCSPLGGPSAVAGAPFRTSSIIKEPPPHMLRWGTDFFLQRRSSVELRSIGKK